ncbi:diaminopimelate epimerase-like [Liolophura sinensis]|uniref:diaminopimelate epimerase-like n=1 Tax=Liolophura sinensis TaxID=3198878 RepID=UPI0031581C43
MEFSKYHALGNNFIFVDNRNGENDFSKEAFIARLCDPRTGIGADGLVEIRSCENAEHSSCAFEFVYHCSDGRLGSFCGNGGRCAVKFAVQLGLASANEDVTFCTAYDGEHVGHLSSGSGLVRLQLRNIEQGMACKLDENTYQIDTGGCNFVTYVDDLESFDVQKDGDDTRLTHDVSDDEGFNKMYVQNGETPWNISVRSYECGVNGETLACGTGAAGAALVTVSQRSVFTEPTAVKVNVKVRLGTLTVTARRMGEWEFSDVYLIGPACHVFDGVVGELY